MKGKRLLLVEDNEKILRGNQRLLEWEGYEVDAARTLEQAEQCFEARRPDAVILDIMLPDGNGLKYMKALRQGRDGDVPILLLTGLTSQEDVIQGLAAGGDDYLTKPYDFPILLARIEALLRRADRIPKTLQAGKLVLDITSCTASMEGRDLLLTQKEFALLSRRETLRHSRRLWRDCGTRSGRVVSASCRREEKATAWNRNKDS